MSAIETAPGAPVLFTVSGDLLSIVGCRPEFTLDTGDGSPLRSFAPPWGTLLTGRVAHAYDDPGQYTVTVRKATGCPGPLTSEPGDIFGVYDVSETIVVTVRP
ncbi:MAG: PKD domain-containing protein [Geodermatophilaceae bacterium]